MEEKPTWLEIHYKSGKVAVMEWDEYDHFIGVLENTPLDEHEIEDIVEVEAVGVASKLIKIWWSREQIEGKV